MSQRRSKIATSSPQLGSIQIKDPQSPKWKIFVDTSEGIIPPMDMYGIASEIILNHIPPQQLIIFESDTEAYVAICPLDFIPKVVKMAAVTDSEKTLAYVRQLAP